MPFRDLQGSWNPFRSVLINLAGDRVLKIGDRPVPRENANGELISMTVHPAKPICVWNQGPRTAEQKNMPQGELASPLGPLRCVLPSTSQTWEAGSAAGEERLRMRHSHNFRMTDIRSVYRYCFTTPLTLLFRGQDRGSARPTKFVGCAAVRSEMPVSYEFVLWGPVGIVIRLCYGRSIYLVCQSVMEADRLQFALSVAIDRCQCHKLTSRSGYAGVELPRNRASDSNGAVGSNLRKGRGDPPCHGFIYARPWGESGPFKRVRWIASRALRRAAKKSSKADGNPPSPSTVYVYRSRVPLWQRLRHKLSLSPSPLTIDLRQCRVEDLCPRGLSLKLTAIVPGVGVKESVCVSVATYHSGHTDSPEGVSVGQVGLSMELTTKTIQDKSAWLDWMLEHGSAIAATIPSPQTVNSPVRHSEEVRKEDADTQRWSDSLAELDGTTHAPALVTKSIFTDLDVTDRHMASHMTLEESPMERCSRQSTSKERDAANLRKLTFDDTTSESVLCDGPLLPVEHPPRQPAVLHEVVAEPPPLPLIDASVDGRAAGIAIERCGDAPPAVREFPQSPNFAANEKLEAHRQGSGLDAAECRSYGHFALDLPVPDGGKLLICPSREEFPSAVASGLLEPIAVKHPPVGQSSCAAKVNVAEAAPQILNGGHASTSGLIAKGSPLHKQLGCTSKPSTTDEHPTLVPLPMALSLFIEDTEDSLDMIEQMFPVIVGSSVTVHAADSGQR